VFKLGACDAEIERCRLCALQRGLCLDNGNLVTDTGIVQRLRQFERFLVRIYRVVQNFLQRVLPVDFEKECARLVCSVSLSLSRSASLSCAEY
jgi:hypothetical protein